MNLTERVERLERLVGVGIPEDIQAIGQLIESTKEDTAFLHSLLGNADRELWASALNQEHFHMLWYDVLPVIFREARERGYLRMTEGDILIWHWSKARSVVLEVRAVPSDSKGERE